VLSVFWVQRTHHHAIIVWVLPPQSSRYPHVVTPTDTSSCYHHIVSSTDTSLLARTPFNKLGAMFSSMAESSWYQHRVSPRDTSVMQQLRRPSSTSSLLLERTSVVGGHTTHVEHTHTHTTAYDSCYHHLVIQVVNSRDTIVMLSSCEFERHNRHAISISWNYKMMIAWRIIDDGSIGLTRCW